MAGFAGAAGLALDPSGLWISQNPFVLPNSDTRRVELAIDNVVMKDGAIWSSDGTEMLEPLPEQSGELPIVRIAAGCALLAAAAVAGGMVLRGKKNSAAQEGATVQEEKGQKG